MVLGQRMSTKDLIDLVYIYGTTEIIIWMTIGKLYL
jgi:hypothetical protein